MKVTQIKDTPKRVSQLQAEIKDLQQKQQSWKPNWLVNKPKMFLLTKDCR